MSSTSTAPSRWFYVTTENDTTADNSGFRDAEIRNYRMAMKKRRRQLNKIRDDEEKRRTDNLNNDANIEEMKDNRWNNIMEKWENLNE